VLAIPMGALLFFSLFYRGKPPVPAAVSTLTSRVVLCAKRGTSRPPLKIPSL